MTTGLNASFLVQKGVILSKSVIYPPISANKAPGLGAVFHLEFIKNILHVKSNCAFFDDESQRDLAVPATPRDKFQNFKLTKAQDFLVLLMYFR